MKIAIMEAGFLRRTTVRMILDSLEEISYKENKGFLSSTFIVKGEEDDMKKFNLMIEDYKEISE